MGNLILKHVAIGRYGKLEIFEVRSADGSIEGYQLYLDGASLGDQGFFSADELKAALAASASIAENGPGGYGM